MADIRKTSELRASLADMLMDLRSVIMDRNGDYPSLFGATADLVVARDAVLKWLVEQQLAEDDDNG